MTPTTAPVMIFGRAKALAFAAAHPGTPGICRMCGCTHYNPCLFQIDPGGPTPVPPPYHSHQACGWADTSRTLCDNPACLAQAKEGPPHAASPST
jgi:hypothetical protein